MMSEATVTILIPTPLRRFTGGAAKVPVTGATVGEALASLDAIHPGISEKVLGDDGEIRRFVAAHVAEEIDSPDSQRAKTIDVAAQVSSAWDENE